MAKHNVVTSDAEIDRFLRDMESPSAAPEASEVRVIWRAGASFVQVKMDNEAIHVFPVARLEGLGSATPEQLGNVELNEARDGIFFPDLDLDFYVPSLILGVYGTKAWMAVLGRQGGRSRSDAKVSAARRNGLKGGRPRKDAAHDLAFEAADDSMCPSFAWDPDCPD